MIQQLLLQVALIALNAVFACAEIAVISIKDARLAMLVKEGDRRALKLAALTSKPAAFLATIQVAITLAGFLGSAFAADNFSKKLAALIMDTGAALPIETVESVSVVAITLVLSYFTLVFGELVPKRLAMKNAERLALKMAGMLNVISRVFAPLVWLLTASTNGTLRLIGVDPASEPEHVTEEEIRMMIDVGSEKGAIDDEEKKMLQNVFEFDDMTAGELATHRTDADMLSMDDSVEEWEETIHSTRRTRYPIYKDTADDIVGILDARDFFRCDSRDKERIIKEAVSEPVFVPESIKADALFIEMRKKRYSFAVVLDEYGGVEGVITVNDLLEAIVGGVAENDGGDIMKPLGDGSWLMSGSVGVDEAASALGVEIAEGDYDTLGGLIFATLGRVIADGDTAECETDTLRISVKKVEEHRVKEAIVAPLCAQNSSVGA